jgi:hypothetical protein
MGVEVRHMWGMTELSPLGSLGVPTSLQMGDGLSQQELIDIKVIAAWCRMTPLVWSPCLWWSNV